jgi:hypothetical protein
MGLIRNIARLFERRDFSLSDPALLALLGGWPTAAAKPVTPQTVFRSSTAAAAIRVLSETCGSLPIHVYRKSADGSREREANHPAAAILAGDANPWTSSSDLRTQVQMDALLHRHGGFIQVLRAGGKVQELHRRGAPRRRRGFLGVSCMRRRSSSRRLYRCNACSKEPRHLGLEPVSVDIRTGLCPGPGIPPGKSLARPETGAPILATTADFGRQRPRSPASPPAKPRKVKDYSDGARKPKLRRSVWWCW